jgi:predicted kinase
MPCFISIGGPPSAGKSTLVRNFLEYADISCVDDHSLKQMIDCKKRSLERSEMAHKLCLQMLSFLMANKKSIIFEIPPNFVSFFNEAQELLKDSNYKYLHLFLYSDMDTCIQRKKKCSRQEGKYWSTTPEIIKEYYFKALEIHKSARFDVINTANLSEKEVLQKLLEVLQTKEIFLSANLIN